MEPQENRNRPPWPFILIVIPPLLFALGVFLDHREEAILQRMQSASGQIQKAEVYSKGQGESTTYHLDLRYEYTIAERDYSGYKIGLANIMYNEKAEALEVLKKYPKGSQVTVYYDPQDPELAVLEKSEPGNGAMTMALSVILLLILWPVAFLVLWQARKNQTSAKL